MSQNQRVLTWLQSGKPLTTLVGFKEIGTLRLGARIWDLRQAGHDIRKRMIPVGDRKQVAEYVLIGSQK